MPEINIQPVQIDIEPALRSEVIDIVMILLNLNAFPEDYWVSLEDKIGVTWDLNLYIYDGDPRATVYPVEVNKEDGCLYTVVEKPIPVYPARVPLRENKMLYRCPRCNSKDISAGPMDTVNLYRSVTCNNCHYTWTETFEFRQNYFPVQ